LESSLPKQSADATNRYEAVPGKRIRLAAIETAATGGYAGKADARAELRRLRKQIDAFVRRLGAEKRRAVLVVLQGVDASGKDGAVRRVFSGVNPQLCRVTAFEEPNAEELKHDYLWRVHRAMPEKGVVGVFNRSHYEEILVPRARGQLSTKNTRIRMRQISDAERMWTENDITLLKFFLHISRKEQTKRFQARLDDPEKRWKVKQSDLKDRKLWRSFQHAYEDAISYTTRSYAPWYIVPADHKWYRDVVIAQVLLDALRRIDPKYPDNPVKKSA
jgi:PPK2 family polyphosphate:nucleotide phosphotransferase